MMLFNFILGLNFTGFELEKKSQFTKKKKKKKKNLEF